ncbi:MAG TPA: aspartate carbamoyltransferase catalytic subunit [Gammaproteobacteria bacterium]|nr:aspartate carbamoyltransferase catalytic subunit [Gammaproteobacteria bacterium]
MNASYVISSPSQIEPQHILSINDFNRSQIYQLLEQAKTWVNSTDELIAPAPLLANKTVINLLFENSTRTRSSFELAAKRLGAVVLNFNAGISSVRKGETLFDTVDNLAAMGADLFVIRHPEELAPAKVAAHLGQKAWVINAGDGCNEHPTQALLDMFTIWRYKNDFTRLSVAIVGDIKHSRVAHSDLQALTTLGVTDIRLVGPVELLPTTPLGSHVSLHQDLQKGIKDADVIIMLRIQKERMQAAALPLATDYFAQYGLTTDKLKFSKPDAIVMHPGPMNRGVEIESAVADGEQSVILRQVTFGIAVRMGLMVRLLT